MIKFDLPGVGEVKVITEVNQDAALARVGIDSKEIKDTYRDYKSGDKTLVDVGKSVSDKGVSPVADLTDKISGKLAGQTVDTTSLIARARNSVLQFPLYITQGIPVSAAHIIGGYFERVYATLVQTVLSQNPIINSEDINNMKFLKQYHANLRESADRLYNEYYEPIDDSDRMMKEAVFKSIQINDNLWLEFRVIPCIDEDLIMENARMLNDPLAGFEALMEKPAPAVTTKDISTERDTPETIVGDEYLKQVLNDLETRKDDKGNKYHFRVKNTGGGHTNVLMNDIDDIKKHIRSGNNPPLRHNGVPIHHRPAKDPSKNPDGEFFIPSKRGATREVITAPRDLDAVKAPILLRDTDIKKINGMLPYTIEASFRVKLPDGNYDRDVRFVIGVKSVMHLISVKDLSGEVRELIMGNMKGLQKVRYKTGEISKKDYLFNPKALKADAAKHIDHDKRWMNTLKRLADYDKLKGTLLKKSVTAMAGGQVPIPNGTLILSQPDIAKIINENGIDLSEVAQAKRLAKSLFLIAVVIVDTTAETMRVLFVDSDNDWDVQSLFSLDAEIAKSDTSALRSEVNKKLFG